MTTAMPTTLPIDPALTPLNNYLLALNALVGQLSINESTQLDPVELCQKYELHPDFLGMLAKMGFLVEDDSGQYPAYKRTKSLLGVQPNQAKNWMINFLKGDQLEETTEQKQQVAEIQFNKPTDNAENLVLEKEPKKVSKNPAPRAERLKSALVELINKLSFYEFREINVDRVYDTYDLDWSFFEVLLQRGFISRSKHQKSFRFKKSKGFAAKVSVSKLDEIESWFEPAAVETQVSADSITVEYPGPDTIKISSGVHTLEGNIDELADRAQAQLDAINLSLNPESEILRDVDQQLTVTNDEIDEVNDRIAESVATTDETAKSSCNGDCGMNYCDDNGCIERDRHYVKHPVSPDPVPPIGGPLPSFQACTLCREELVSNCRTYGCLYEQKEALNEAAKLAKLVKADQCTNGESISDFVQKAPEPLPTDWLLRHADGTIIIAKDSAEALDRAVSISKDDEAVVIVYRPVYLAKPKVIKTAEINQID